MQEDGPGRVKKKGGFEDVGDTYGPIGGAYAGGDAAESGKGSGISYQTDDAVPVANSHDL